MNPSMKLLEKIQAHKGKLIQITTEIFRFGSSGWDGIPSRVCLLMNAGATLGFYAPLSSTATARLGASSQVPTCAALLLIDGQPQWVCVAEEDLVLL
jgi:hypothetical protein